MNLDREEVRDSIDELAQRIVARLSDEQAVSGESYLRELQTLRSSVAGFDENGSETYYSYLRIRQNVEQMFDRLEWAQSRFWGLFWMQFSILIGLLLIGGSFITWIPRLHWLTANAVQSVYLACAWWGAVASTMHGLHTLYDSRIRGTLSKSLEAWIWAKQLSGGVLGLVAGVFVQFLSESFGHEMASTAFAYAMAFFAGFSESKFLALLQSKLGILIRGSD